MRTHEWIRSTPGQKEQRSAYLYRACADAETARFAPSLPRLAREAEAQAAILRARLTARGCPAPAPFVPTRARASSPYFVQWLGPRRLRDVLSAMKVRGMAVYSGAVPPEPGTRRQSSAPSGAAPPRSSRPRQPARRRIRRQQRPRVQREPTLRRRRRDSDVRIIVLSGVAAWPRAPCHGRGRERLGQVAARVYEQQSRSNTTN